MLRISFIAATAMLAASVNSVAVDIDAGVGKDMPPKEVKAKIVKR